MKPIDKWLIVACVLAALWSFTFEIVRTLYIEHAHPAARPAAAPSFDPRLVE